MPAITPSYSGFVNNETAATLSTQATCTVAPNSSAVGTHPTTCSGAADPNYSFTYVPGTLTVNQASQSITFGALLARVVSEAISMDCRAVALHDVK